MGINIKISAGNDPNACSVIATGSMQHVITDAERDSFGLNDSALKKAVASYFGKAPNDAYLRSPTPWGDLYKTYGWQQVQTILVARDAQILSMTSHPTILKTTELRNNSTKPGTFSTSINDSVTNTTETNWNMTTTTEFSETISCEIGFEGLGSMGTSSTWSLGFSVGVGGSQSQSISVGSDQGVTVDLDPGESVQVQLSASNGELKARIFYDVYLVGLTAVNYNPTYKDHHFWALDISSVMASGNIKNRQSITQDITVGYYSNSSVTLSDLRKLTLSALSAPVA
ncbi:follicular epithelium yolk protein subunit [Pectobacterium aroidearum]|jgi:hypothetical protein|uniref:follicular epithelium yolk protein subunit n=1 Tax=Pectobacterium aroidearum TaxID=1201031 RepID=UPI002A80F89F|nr:follicular epithelium yolk protein subunit [Pectobacterium aroidearum]MDY4389128.1 follicular epithelium yolk protein subunit [Pectobacterium aroidearum]